MLQSTLFKLPMNIIINAFFASLFDSKTSFSSGTKPPDLKDKMKPPSSKGDYYHWPDASLRHTKVYGDRWDSPKSTEGTVGSAHPVACNHLPADLANRGDSSWLQGNKCCGHPQEGTDEGSRERQACQPPCPERSLRK